MLAALVCNINSAGIIQQQVADGAWIKRNREARRKAMEKQRLRALEWVAKREHEVKLTDELTNSFHKLMGIEEMAPLVEQIVAPFRKQYTDYKEVDFSWMARNEHAARELIRLYYDQLDVELLLILTAGD